KQLPNRHEIPQAFAHLLAFDLQEPVVHPVIRHHQPMERAARLGDLVLVVGKHQVDAAAVNVEGFAEMLPRHRRAFDMPAGPARRYRTATARRARWASMASTARNPWDRACKGRRRRARQRASRRAGAWTARRNPASTAR